MPKTTIDKQSVVREVLQSTRWTRDALPYTDEFETLYSQ